MFQFLFCIILSLIDCSTGQSVKVNTVDTTRFASKNSYASSSTDFERQQARATLNIINSYCKPLQVSILLRHGTRNPSDGDINNINNIISKLLAANTSSALIQELIDVAKKFPIETEGELVDAGALEHQGIGFRLADVFSNLFRNPRSDRLSFSSTSKSRTFKSSKAFQTGFFKQQSQYQNTSIRDDVLRFYDKCRAYEDLQSNPASSREFKKFINKYFPAIMQRYINNLRTPSLNITYDEMDSIYQVGGIEYAALGTTRWSQFIDPEDLLKLEYVSDLESYYELGYGFPLNYEMSCPLMSEIFLGMDKAFNSNEYLRGNFYFAHSQTLVPLMSLLGLYKDPRPLMADDYHNQQNRTYKSSRIDPFASNLGFVQYECDVDKILANPEVISNNIFPKQPESNMTLLLVKEQPTKFPVCDELVCPYSTIRRFYSPYIDDCSFDEMCQNFGTSLLSGSLRTLLIGIAGLYLLLQEL